MNSGQTKRVRKGVPSCWFGTRSSFASVGEEAGTASLPRLDRFSDAAVGGLVET